MVKLEVGKFYKTRDGRKVGPMREQVGDGCLTPYTFNDGLMSWTEEGEYNLSRNESHLDIVSEPAVIGPIRTRREIIPGVYGRVEVRTAEGFEEFASVGLTAGMGRATFITTLNAEQLREAAHLFNQLAEVLEDV